MQHLAAGAAITDLEDLADTSFVTTEPIIRRNAERLGCLYSIASKWTSFVAVEQATEITNDVSLYKPLTGDLGTLMSSNSNWDEIDLKTYTSLSSDYGTYCSVDVSRGVEKSFPIHSNHYNCVDEGWHYKPSSGEMDELRVMVDRNGFFILSESRHQAPATTTTNTEEIKKLRTEDEEFDADILR